MSTLDIPINFLKEYLRIIRVNRVIILTFAFFILGLHYYTNSYKYYEQMENKTQTSTNTRCPNMLIEKDGNYYLYNSKLAI